MVLGLIGDSVNKAYTPWLMKNLAEKSPARNAAVIRFTYAWFAAVLAIALALGLAAPWVLVLLVGEQFRSAAPMVIYIALGQAFIAMYYMVAQYIFVANRTASLAAVSLGAGLLNVPLSWWLVVQNGALGAAQATMLAQALLFFGTWYMGHRAHPMPWATALSTR
jgi:O-antigen/teichoic acid export membrane protein